MIVRSLESQLEESKEKRDKKLMLNNLEIKNIPDLSQFDWVEKLDLSNNKIKKIVLNYLPPNLKLLDISDNKIVDITDLPLGLIGIDLSSNLIEMFDGRNFTGLKELLISDNRLEVNKFKFSPNLTICDISCNFIECLDDFPEHLKCINASENCIKKVGKFNSKLEKISLSENKIETIQDLPDSITWFDCSKNSLDEIDIHLSTLLEDLNLADNKIVKFESVLPPNLRKLNLSKNLIKEMPDLPDGVEQVDLSHNVIDELKDIPDSVTTLNVNDNSLTNISSALQLRYKSQTLDLKYEDNYIFDDEDEDDDNEWDYFWNNGKQSTNVSLPSNLDYTNNTNNTNRRTSTSIHTTQAGSPPNYQSNYSSSNWRGNSYSNNGYNYNGGGYNYNGGGYYSGGGYQSYNNNYSSNYSGYSTSSYKTRNTNPNFISANYKKKVTI